MNKITLVSLCAIMAAVSRPTLAVEPTRTIMISARSEVMVEPDEVVIRARVTTHDKDIYNAKSVNDKIAQRVLTVARSHGLPDKDVMITDMDVSPVHDRYREFIHYEFERSLEFTLTDFTEIEPLLSDLIEAGVTRIDRVHFRVADQRKHQIEARRLAVEYAKVKASHLAELNDQRLGLAIHIREDVENNWNAGGAFGFGGGAGASLTPDLGNRLVQSRGQSVESRPPGTHAVGSRFHLAAWYQAEPEEKNNKKATSPNKKNTKLLAPGQIEINATVTIQFELLAKSEPKK